MLYRPGLLGRLPCPQDWYFGSGPPTIDDSFVGAVGGGWAFTRASANATDCLYSDGVITPGFRNYNTNEPRLLPFGLLIEPQRTNLFLNSEAPVTQNVTVVFNVVYTVWMHGTGSIVLTGAGSSGTVTQGSPVTFTSNAGAPVTCTLSGSVTRVQFEAGKAPTSYIQTAGATNTRAADKLTQNFFGGQINQVQGTYWVEYMVASTVTEASTALLVAGGGASNTNNCEYIMLDVSGAPSGPTVFGIESDASSVWKAANYVKLPKALGSVSRAAFSVSQRKTVIAADYVLSPPLDPNFRPSNLLNLTLGCGGGLQELNGYIRGFKYWRTAMPDAELKECTGAGYYRSGPVFDFDFTTGVLPRQLTYLKQGVSSGVTTDSFYTDAPGTTYNTYANTVPRVFVGRGVLTESIRYNYYTNSNVPITRVTPSFGVNVTLCAWMIGTGSITLSNGTGTIGTIDGSLTITAGQLRKFVMATAGTINVTVAGTVNRVQLEALNLSAANNFALAPTSFIQTTAAPQSHGTDYLYMPIRNWYNIDQSTYYIELVPLGPSLGYLFPISCWSSSSNREQIFLQTPDVNTAGSVTNVQGQSSWTGGVGLNGVLIDSSITQGVSHKLAYALSAITGVRMQGQLAKDGISGPMTNAGDVSGPAQPYPTTMSFNGNAAGGVGNFYIRRVRYYDYQMTDAEMAALTANPGPSLDISFLASTLDPSIAFTRNSTATYFDVNGTMQSAAINAPRFGYDPVSHAPRGLLIEEARTNTVINSNSADLWGQNATTATANATASPDGTTNAAKITPTTANVQHAVNLQGPRTITAGALATLSVYVKPAGYPRMWVAFYNAAFNSGVSATFNPATGAITPVAYAGTASSGSASIVPISNGWYRLIISGILDATSVSSNSFLYIDNGTTNSFPGDGTSGMYMWGAQMEVGAFATSYIPTTAASVTRAIESVTMPTAAWYNTNALTYVLDGTIIGVNAGNQQLVGFSASGSANDRTNIFLQANGQPSLITVVGGVATVGPITNGSALASGTFFRAGASVSTGANAFSVNGAVATTATSVGGLMPACNILRLAGLSATNSDLIVSRLRVWPRAMSSTELQQVTT